LPQRMKAVGEVNTVEGNHTFARVPRNHEVIEGVRGNVTKEPRGSGSDHIGADRDHEQRHGRHDHEVTQSSRKSHRTTESTTNASACRLCLDRARLPSAGAIVMNQQKIPEEVRAAARRDAVDEYRIGSKTTGHLSLVGFLCASYTGGVVQATP